MSTINAQLKLRRDTTTNWNLYNPVLAEGEIGVDLTVDQFILGDGTTYWTGLTYNGTSGTDGSSGTSGTNGTSGISGSSGTSGTSGSSGTSGVDGTSGTDGTSGISGSSGTSGNSGSSGTSGVDGTSGTDGADGTSGTSGISGASLDTTIVNGAILYKKGTSITGSTISFFNETQGSIAVGDRLVASGYNSSAFGTDNNSTGSRSGSLGEGNQSTYTNTLAIGRYNAVSGWASFAGNSSNTVSGSFSTVLGSLNIVSGDDAFGTGERNRVYGYNQTVVGQWNLASGSTTFSTGSTHPLFIVGCGTGSEYPYDNGRRNGFEVRANADVYCDNNLFVAGFLPQKQRVRTLIGSGLTYSGLTTDQYVRISGTTTIYYPIPATGSGKIITIKNIGDPTITIDGDGTDTIDELETLDIIDYNGSVKLIDADTGKWEIIGAYSI